MQRTLLVFALLWSAVAAATEYPAASAEQRAQRIDEYTASCVTGVEAVPDLRALYSHATVQAYCTCRQRYSADVLAQAAKKDQRGKAVEDRMNAYAEAKCTYVLVQQLEHE
ncbi:MAG: hypothetical protein ABWY06_13085 [Pseudomonas sp.]|uniref:hypothetical protein n=1 Tax=Pseudomonas sp. TaxID=306 RepID=UPI003399E148